MKTTLDVSDPLLEEAKAVAARERTTLRALVEQGLRIVLATKGKRSARFRLRQASFKGRGLQEGFERARWDRIRNAAYSGRGA